MSMKKDLIKLQKHIEKKQEQYSSSTDEENKSLNSLNIVAASGKKLLINSVIDTFKVSLDNLAKRIESFLYFSSLR